MLPGNNDWMIVTNSIFQRLVSLLRNSSELGGDILCFLGVDGFFPPTLKIQH